MAEQRYSNYKRLSRPEIEAYAGANRDLIKTQVAQAVEELHTKVAADGNEPPYEVKLSLRWLAPNPEHPAHPDTESMFMLVDEDSPDWTECEIEVRTVLG